MTLYDKVMFCLLFEQRKHGKGDDFAVNQINALTNEELLKAISDALEEMQGEPK